MASNRFQSTIQTVGTAIIVLAGLSSPWPVFAQDPNLAPNDLLSTKAVIEKNHLIAHASMQVAADKFVHFQYDRYSDVHRITTEDGTAYAQVKGKRWLKSSDWGKTGKPVKPDKVQELETDVSVAEAPLAEPVSHDASQGSTVWKFIEQTKENDIEYFIYERTREHPHADGVYPRYRFIKYKNDKDGGLFLDSFTAQMRSGDKMIPVEIKYGLMIPLPANTVIEVAPEKGKK